MANIVFCDIDGVLADNTHRLHYALEDKEYEKFYSAPEVSDDEVIEAGLELLESLTNHSDDKVFYITGRNECCRSATEMWIMRRLRKTVKISAFRKDGDHRPSPEVKVEMIQKIKDLMPSYFVPHNYLYFIDDDPKNVEAVCKAFPEITGITFGIGRFHE